MNRLILFVAVLCATSQLEAQSIKKRDVPEVVTSKLINLYPEASKIKWEMEDGMYEGSFISDNKETSLFISGNGTLVMTEIEVEVSTLPAAIADYVRQHHATSSITEASITTDNAGDVIYEVEVDDIEYVFDSTGRMLSQEVEEEDKD